MAITGLTPSTIQWLKEENGSFQIYFSSEAPWPPNGHFDFASISILASVTVDFLSLVVFDSYCTVLYSYIALSDDSSLPCKYPKSENVSLELTIFQLFDQKCLFHVYERVRAK